MSNNSCDAEEAGGGEKVICLGRLRQFIKQGRDLIPPLFDEYERPRNSRPCGLPLIAENHRRTGENHQADRAEASVATAAAAAVTAVTTAITIVPVGRI